jgi:CYTH domain-containing protein
MNSHWEIERKFLVKDDSYKLQASRYHHIIQAYLNRNPNRTVRIRIKDATAFITVKGNSNTAGTKRYEWEKEIPVEEARQLIQLAEPGVIEKIRYIIPADKGLFWEVDEFLGENQGLVLAEIELPDENTPFKKPEWLGEEVTGQSAYYNANM